MNDSNDNSLERDIFPSTSMKNEVIKDLPSRTPLPLLLEKRIGINWVDTTRATKNLILAEWREIIYLIDLISVFSVSSLHDFCVMQDVRVKKCNRRTLKEEEHYKPPSRPSISAFLNLLHKEKLIVMEIFNTGYLKPAKVYYVEGTNQEEIERFTAYYKACEEDYQRRKKKKLSIKDQKEYWSKQSEAAKELKSDQDELAKQTAVRDREGKKR